VWCEVGARGGWCVCGMQGGECGVEGVCVAQGVGVFGGRRL
jgi:hypothetical protein